MRLFDWKAAPNPRRVRMFLAEKNIDMEIIDVGEPGAPKLKDEFLNSNPHRIVPALELDDGTVIGEAPVICRYLETVHPTPSLLGADPKEQAAIAMWDRKCEFEGLHAVAEVLRNKAKAFAGRALPGYTIPIEQIDGLIERGTVRVGAFYAKLDHRLGESTHLATKNLSFADITAFCVVDMAKAGKMTIPDGCANVSRWYESVASRPSAKA
ncbi:MAG: glutathione S-transferase family protein [Gammaproteobacteria bacterium]|nr:glutathione S-transferase family protein [Gammaproteobacteria bacterium]